MIPETNDEAYWKPTRLRVAVERESDPESFRVMEIFPEARNWTAKKNDLVKLEVQRMTRVKLSPEDMLTYRRFNDEIHTQRQRAMEALHAYTWNPDSEGSKIWWVQMQSSARRMRDLCQENNAFMVALEKKYDFSRRDSIVLDLYTDEIGIHPNS